MYDDIKKDEQDSIIEKEHNWTIIEKHEFFYTVKDNATGDIFTINKKDYIKPKGKRDPKASLVVALGLIFIFWFVGSLFLTFILGNINSYYAVICMGQYFLVFGIIALLNKAWPGIIFSIVGLALIVIPIMMMNPQLDINWDKVLPLIILGAFFVIGIGLIIIPSIVKKMLNKKTPTKVMAKVVEVKEDHFDGVMVYSPVYEFYFNSKNYRIDKGNYSNVNVLKVNDIVELWINPDDPEEFRIEDSGHVAIIMMALIGALFVGVSLLALYLFLFSN